MRRPAKPLPHTAPSQLSSHTSKACQNLLGARLLLTWLVVGAAVMAAPATVRADHTCAADTHSAADTQGVVAAH